MMNPIDSMVTVVNNGFTTRDNLLVQAKAYDMDGKEHFYSQVFNSIGPSSVRRYFPLNDFLIKLDKKEGVFVSLKILNEAQDVLSENLYWLPGKDGRYSGLQKIKTVVPIIEGQIAVTLSNAKDNPVAFFNRIALVDAVSGKRILPAFYSDNYISVLPGESKTITVDYSGSQKTAVEVYGWNVERKKIEVR